MFLTLYGQFCNGGNAANAVGGLAEVVALVGLLNVLDDARAVNDFDVPVGLHVEVVIVGRSRSHLQVGN